MIETRFKKTEIGEIPEDWEIDIVEDLFKFYVNNTFSRDMLNKNGNIYNIHYGDILVKFGSILDVEKDYLPAIDKHILYSPKSYICNGDVVIADTAEDEMVGKACEVQNVGDRKIVAGLHTMWLHPKDDLFSPGFLGYFINSKIYHNQLLPLIQGIKVSSVSKTALKETCVLRPNKNEQQRIATALSDIDALLSTLNKKIAKKKLIKQGAMQQLLTGKMRLAGFTEPWVEKKLGEIGSFIGGGTPNTKIEEYWNGTIPWISSSDISNGDIRNINITRYITEEAIKVSATNKCPIGSILLITRVGIGKLAVADQMICTSQDFTNICIGTDYNSIFIALLLSRLMMAKRDEGQGSTIKGITTEEIKSMIILLPLSIAEQTAIATILSDMDKEIEQLEAKRAKYEQVKQGMMQQLLTGKIRLID